MCLIADFSYYSYLNKMDSLIIRLLLVSDVWPQNNFYSGTADAPKVLHFQPCFEKES